MTKDEALKVLHECNRAVISLEDAEQIAKAFGETLESLNTTAIENYRHHRLNYREDEAEMPTVAVYQLARDLAKKLTGEEVYSNMNGQGSYAEDISEKSIKLLEKAAVTA